MSASHQQFSSGGLAAKTLDESVFEELARAHAKGRVRLPARGGPWLDTLRRQADALPESEAELIAEILGGPETTVFLPSEYGLPGKG
jgi:hypothetical protein